MRRAKTFSPCPLGLETLFYQSARALIAYKRVDCEIYYWATVNGVEVDFVLYSENALVAVEIKHASTIQPSMLTGLKHFKEDYPMARSFILYMGKETHYLAKDVVALPFLEGLKQLEEWVI